MNSQTISPESMTSSGRVAPQSLLEWTNSSSGTQWERFRDSGTLDSGVYFVGSPFRGWRLHALVGVSLLLIAIIWALTGPLHHASRFTTDGAEQRSETLADGTMLRLGQDSDVRIAFTPSERHVILARGAVTFKVASDPDRPFLVSTPQATVEALGTAFHVRAVGQQTTVRVLEGRVSILPPVIDETPGAPTPASKELSVGESALVTGDGDVIT